MVAEEKKNGRGYWLRSLADPSYENERGGCAIHRTALRMGRFQAGKHRVRMI